MSSVTARRLCPDLVFVKPRFEAYREVSSTVREIFHQFTPIVEPLSLDEAYLDVTNNLKGIALARDVAEEIRSSIRIHTGLTASAGVSYCKFLAKMASDMRKPDGMYVIPPGKGKDYVSALPIGKFHGIGPATADRMMSLGIFKGADIENAGEAFLVENFGKSGSYFYQLSLGIDDREVNTDRVRKSIGAENTFDRDIIEYSVIRDEAVIIAERVWERVVKHAAKGRTVSLKVKFEDFEEISRSKTSTIYHTKSTFMDSALDLLGGLFPSEKGIRLIGYTLSGLADEHHADITPQLSLFD